MAAMVVTGAAARCSSTSARREVNDTSSSSVRSAPEQKWPSAPVSTSGAGAVGQRR